MLDHERQRTTPGISPVTLRQQFNDGNVNDRHDDVKLAAATFVIVKGDTPDQGPVKVRLRRATMMTGRPIRGPGDL
jgi:hypothetical protein